MPRLRVARSSPEPTGRVFISCPQTGREVFTRIRVTKTEYERGSFVGSAVRCDVCGVVHAWSKADSRLVPAGG